MKQERAFPYSEDQTLAPYTDGTLNDGDNTSTFLPLCGSSHIPQQDHHLSGCMVPSGYSDTTDMVFATNVAYPQNAGDS
jgi:hypothetical protein